MSENSIDMGKIKKDLKKERSSMESIYQIMTYLTSLYSQNSSSDHRPEGRSLWQKNMDQCLLDVEVIHEIHTARNLEIGYGMKINDPEDVMERVKKLERRLDAVMQNMSDWTYLLKSTHIILLIEEIWVQAIKRWSLRDIVDGKNFLGLAKSSMQRQDVLKRLVFLYESENELSQGANTESIVGVMRSWQIVMN